MVRRGKIVFCILAVFAITFSFLAVNVSAVEASLGSSHDSFLCALPEDGQFWIPASTVDPTYQRGMTYDWLMQQEVFAFRETAVACDVLYYKRVNNGVIVVQTDVNDGGSDPPYSAAIIITKAVIEESSYGAGSDLLWLNFAVRGSSGTILWPNADSVSSAFVNCRDPALGFVSLPQNQVLLNIASYMPQYSPNITNVIRGDTFTNGYNTGYDNGRRDGYQVGKNETYKSAHDEGFNKGYNKGVKDSGKFNFRSFLEAVIFSPIDAFLEILNFDFLGFNMRAFVASVLTLVIVIAIVLIIFKFKG